MAVKRLPIKKTPLPRRLRRVFIGNILYLKTATQANMPGAYGTPLPTGAAAARHSGRSRHAFRADAAAAFFLCIKAVPR